MINPITLTKNSELIGYECAYCKQPFTNGDSVVTCPRDAARHHSHCWQENGGRCSAYACDGSGDLSAPVRRLTPVAQPRPATMRPRTDAGVRPIPRSQPIPPQQTIQPAIEQTHPLQPQPESLPAQAAQIWLTICIGIAIILIAFSCFGIWSIADYVMLEVMGWGYR